MSLGQLKLDAGKRALNFRFPEAAAGQLAQPAMTCRWRFFSIAAVGRGQSRQSGRWRCKARDFGLKVGCLACDHWSSPDVLQRPAFRFSGEAFRKQNPRRGGVWVSTSVLTPSCGGQIRVRLDRQDRHRVPPGLDSTRERPREYSCGFAGARSCRGLTTPLWVLEN